MSSERDAKSPAFQAIVQALVQHERERARRRLLARYDPQQLLALCEQFGIDTSLDEERRLDQIDLGLTIERGRQFVPRSTEKATKARMRKAEEWS